MAIVRMVGMWLLAVIYACAAIGIDYALIRHHRPGTLHMAILVMVLYAGLFGLLAGLAILGARCRDTELRVPTTIVSRKSCRK